MILVNLNQDFSIHNKYLSNTLLKELENTLEKWEKAIIYLNKKWEYSSLVCQDCQKIFRCKNCDVSLKIHSDKMICHICWYRKDLISSCDNCKSKNILKIWVWTEQIEKALKDIFPSKKIFRWSSIRSTKDWIYKNIIWKN